MSNQLIYTGKAKDIYSTEDENVIKSVYKDQATMLNGARKETIKGKGVLNNQISSLIFEKLNAAGVATHFIERISDTEQLNKKVTIIPLEVVLRNVTAGSFSKRFGVEEGLDLKTPIVEFYYKNDDLDDPFINDEHVKFLNIANDEQIAYIKDETRRINELLKDCSDDQVKLYFNPCNFSNTTSYTSVKLPRSRRKTSLSIWCPSASQRRQLSGENSSAKIILPSLSKPNSNLKSIKRRPICSNQSFSNSLIRRVSSLI